MKTQKNKLTKIGMILLMGVASLVNTENANGQLSQGTGGTIVPNSPTTNTNVGIGTNNPAFKLQVVPSTTGNSGIGIYNGGTGGAEVRFQSSVVGTHNYGIGNCGSTPNASLLGNFGIYDYSAIGGGTYRLMINANGNLGLGTTAPCELLSVAGTVQVDANAANNGTIENSLKFGACGNGEAIGSKKTATGNQYGLDFYTASTNRMAITNAGNVGIGTTTPITKLQVNGSVYIGAGTYTLPTCNPTASRTPAGYKLYVETGILTEKVKVAVKTTCNWADHVFAKDYQLQSLDEVEQYIKANQHLPGISSATELVNDGLDIGEMQAKQMQKIEELTLYMIEMKKEIESLKRENVALKSSNNNK